MGRAPDQDFAGKQGRPMTTNPEALSTLMGVSPTVLAKAPTATWVWLEVCRPRISSSSCVAVTGLKKCTPDALKSTQHGGQSGHENGRSVGGDHRVRRNHVSDLVQDAQHCRPQVAQTLAMALPMAPTSITPIVMRLMKNFGGLQNQPCKVQQSAELGQTPEGEAIEKPSFVRHLQDDG